MSLFANHVRCVLSTGALALSAVGCHTLGINKDGCSDCEPAGPPAVVHLNETAANQFDRPSAPPAAFPQDEAHPPLRADSPADASHSGEIGPTEPAAEPPAPPEVEILASRLEARGARMTHDAFQSVVTIDLSNTDIIDADLEHLYLFESLEQLNLSGTRITNTGLDYVRQSSHLEFLGLTGTRLDDEGVRTLAELSQLRFLSLAGTDVTDRGLAALSRMRSLEAVNLRSTLATDNGVAELQSRLPECRIVFERRSETSPLRGTDIQAIPSETGDGTSWRVGPRSNSRNLSSTDGQFSGPRIEVTRLYPTPDRVAAQRRLEGVLRQKLGDPELLHALAAVRASEGNWFEARRTIRVALEQSPENPGLRFDLAVVLAQCHEFEASFTEFERAVGRAAAHYNLGVLLAEQGRFAAGQRHFVEAVTLDPTLDIAREWLAYTRGDRLDSPCQSDGHGLLTDRDLRSLFGSLLDSEMMPPDEIVIQPADQPRPVDDGRPSVDDSGVQPASAAFRPIRTNPAPGR